MAMSDGHKGFQVPRKTARLQFEGDEFKGCEIVVALDLTFEAGDHFNALQVAANRAKNAEAQGGVDVPVSPIRQLMDFFAANCILSWNLEDSEHKPLPISGASFLQFPGWFGMLILNQWKAAVEEASEVPAPLVEPSKSGNGLAEASEPMEAPSSVPANLPMPSS